MVEGGWEMGGLEYYFSPPKGFNVARARTFAHTQFCTCVEAITLLSPGRCSIHDLSLMSNLRYHSLMAFLKMFFYYHLLSKCLLLLFTSELCQVQYRWAKLATVSVDQWHCSGVDALYSSPRLWRWKRWKKNLLQVFGISILQLCVWTVRNMFDIVSSISKMNFDDMFSVRCSNAISSSKVSFCTQIKII
jgi:hypothetical protein